MCDQVLTGPLTVMAEGEEPPAPWQMYVELWKALLLRQDVPQDVLSECAIAEVLGVRMPTACLSNANV